MKSFFQGAGLLLTVIAFSCRLNAQDGAETSVTLSWQPSPSGNVSGYRIYFGTESGNYTSSNDSGNSTTVVIPGLEAGITYYFVVSAYDAGGVESDFSNEVAYTPAATTTVTLASLQLQSAADGQMVVNLRGPAGRTYDLMASPDLNEWSVIGLVTVGDDGSLSFVDPDAGKYPQRFYRARETQPALQLILASGGAVTLTITGQNGRDYEVQATQDFNDWIVLGTVTMGPKGTMDYSDPEAANYPARYYRTRELQP